MVSNITAQEKQLVKTLFAKAGAQDFDIVTHEQAAQVFAGFGLPHTTLDKIWRIADADNSKFLTASELSAAIRLIGWAQKGMEPTEGLLTQVCSAPILTNGPPPGIRFNPCSPSPSSMYPATPVPMHSTTLQLTTDDRRKFLRTFYESGLVDGLLSGNKARDYFLKSNLPTETLGKIWRLADTHGRGSLDGTDFVIGMFLIQCTIFGRIQTIPSSLPPGLYEQASGGPSFNSHLQTQGTISASSRVDAEPAQNSTSPTRMFYDRELSHSPETTITLRPQIVSQVLKTSTVSRPNWNVPAEEKVRYETIFARLDSRRRGSIEGSVAAEYMRQTQLPEATLSRIWDQVDRNRDGELELDEFALAMYLLDKALHEDEILPESSKTLVPPKSSPDSDPESYPWAAPGVPSQDGTIQMPVPVATGAAYTPAPSAPSGSFFMTTPTQSVEVTNFRNEVLSAQHVIKSAIADRSAIVASVETAASELAQLQGQLAELKEQCKSEEAQLAAFRGRKAQQDADLTSTREELASIESGIEAARAEQNRVERELNQVEEQVREVTAQVVKMKADIEHVVLDTRRLNRSLGIAKEQLAIVDSEKAQLCAQMDDVGDECNSEQEPTARSSSKLAQHYWRPALFFVIFSLPLAYLYFYHGMPYSST